MLEFHNGTNVRIIGTAGSGRYGYSNVYNRIMRPATRTGHFYTTGSLFLGDHFARFSSAPPTGITKPDDGTGAETTTLNANGLLGTNFGSYAYGYYDVDTTNTALDPTSDSSGYDTVLYQGKRYGYVLELRFNRIQASAEADVQASGGDNLTTYDTND